MLRNLIPVFALLTVCVASLCPADDWRPAEVPLATRWAKDVSPDQAWPEYPRPQMVRPEWQNLNGLWDYAIRPKAEAQPDAWDGKILVPFAAESALSGVGKPVKPDQRLWYRRGFSASVPRDGGRLLLHFGAVDWQCTVWVNGRQVGEHHGGYDPFTMDISDAVRDGSNELVVAVWDPTSAGFQPRGKQVLEPRGIWYTAVTGIWQTVWLEPVPAAHVRGLKILPDVDGGSVQVTVDSTGAESLRVTASDKNGTASARGRAGEPVEVKIDNPKLWSPDAPHLYDLKVDLLDGDRVLDAVDSYCGLRKLEVREDAEGINRLFLNDEVLFQYGPLDQGWWPDGLYTPPTDEAIKYDIQTTKRFGMNMARKHVKYEPARWYYWCDKLGLLVWQDMPSGDSARNDQSKANFRRELKLMVDALHNHPSIVMWVPFNEGWGQHDTPEVVAWLEAYDPSRPVNEASGWTDHGSGHISDLHSYPGPNIRPLEPSRSVVLGEFGGLGMPVEGHTWQDRENWGYVSYQTKDELTDAYVSLLVKLRLLIGQGLSAAVYTQTSDVETEVNGLMTYDRERLKLELERVAAAAADLYGPPPKVTTLVPTSESQPQTWRLTTTQPEQDWVEPNFDSSAWRAGQGGFGAAGTPGAIVNTSWDTNDIWLRRSFTLGALPELGDLYLRIHHDEDAEVYLNGRLVAKRPGYVGEYGLAALDPAARASLRLGENVLAVHCHQTDGGQYIDVGLVLVTEK